MFQTTNQLISFLEEVVIDDLSDFGFSKKAMELLQDTICGFNGNFRILNWRYVSTIYKAIFSGDIPWNLGLKNRPYIWLVPPIRNPGMAIDIMIDPFNFEGLYKVWFACTFGKTTNEFQCSLWLEELSIDWSWQSSSIAQYNLVGGISTPLKNMSSSVGMMTFPTEWIIIKFMFQTSKQITNKLRGANTLGFHLTSTS